MTTITISTRRLAQLLTPVLPFAGKDGQLPILTNIKLWTNQKWLVASATDRFRVGMKRVPAEEAETWPAFEALLPTSAARSILTTFKASKGNDPTLKLDFDDAKVTVTASGGLFSGVADLSAAYWLYAESKNALFPDLTNVLAEAVKAAPAPAGQGFSPFLLADFKAVALDRNAAIVIKPTVRGDEKKSPGPMLVLAEDFVGALMGRRFHDIEQTPDGEDWLELFAQHQPTTPTIAAAAAGATA